MRIISSVLLILELVISILAWQEVCPLPSFGPRSTVLNYVEEKMIINGSFLWRFLTFLFLTWSFLHFSYQFLCVLQPRSNVSSGGQAAEAIPLSIISPQLRIRFVLRLFFPFKLHCVYKRNVHVCIVIYECGLACVRMHIWRSKGSFGGLFMDVWLCPLSLSAVTHHLCRLPAYCRNVCKFICALVSLNLEALLP